METLFTREELGKHYDGLPQGGKDMPREDFINEAMGLTDPVAMRRDAQTVATKRKQQHPLWTPGGGVN